MDRFQRFGVARRNAHAAAAFQLFELIFDLDLQPLHLGHTGRRLRVDEHRRGEIAFREFLRDMFQMHADLVSAGIVSAVVGFDLNHAPVGFEQEMMGRFGMREAHRRVAAPVHAVEMAVVRLVLSDGAYDAADQEGKNGCKTKDVFHLCSYFCLRPVERGLSGAKDLASASLLRERVSSNRAGSSSRVESSRLSQSFISSCNSSRMAVIPRKSVSSSSSFAAARSRT